MIEDGAAEYQRAVNDLNESYRSGLRAFAKWFAATWTISRDEWLKDYAEPPPSDEYIKGFNAGVESLDGALDAFLGDYHY